MQARFLGITFLLVSVLAPINTANAVTQTFNYNKSINENGFTITLPATVTVDTPAETIMGTISITAANDTSGQIAFSKTLQFTHSFATTSSNRFVQTAQTPYETMAASCSVAGCMLSKTPDINHDGRVNILDVATSAFAYGSAVGSTRWNPAADLNGNGRVDILDVATAAADYGAPVA